MSTTPYQFIKRGNLFIVPVGPAINEVPYPTYTIEKPKEFSILVRGKTEEPTFNLDKVRMPPSLFQDVRDDLNQFSPVPVSRSAFRRSQHAYVGVIDSKGTPYYFALDSHGISVREVDANDERVWKTFDRLSDEERSLALQTRRLAATEEMRQVDRELSEPTLVIKSDMSEQIARQYAIRMALAAREIAEQEGDEEAVAAENEELEYLGYEEAKKSGGFIWHLLTHRNPAPRAQRAARAAAAEGSGKTKPMKDLNFKTSESGKHHRATASHGTYKISTNSGYRHELTYQRHLHERVKLGTFKTAQEAAAHAHAHHAETHTAIHKALPKKSKSKPVKKTPSKGASKKQAGAGGKTRYSYPGEKKGGGARGAQPLVVVQHDDSKHADPGEFANQLGVSVRTLQRCAKQLGRDGFTKFMRARLKRFSAKHGLDPDYWSTLYERLQTTPSLSASSEDE